MVTLQVGVARRVAQCRAMSADDRQHRFRIALQQTGDECVRMPRNQRMRNQPVGREVPQVPGHDHVRPAPDGSRQHVAVARVGQVEVASKRRISRHDGFRKVPVHDRPGPLQHGGVKIGPVRQQAPCPLGMDVGAPERREQVPVGQPQQQVPKASRIEHVGVEHRPPPRHPLLQAEFLVARGQFVQRRTAAGFRLAAVGHEEARAMVASIGKIASPSQGASYYERGGYEKDDPAHREASRRAGKGAESLRLSGPVDPDTFRQILEGKVPDGPQLGRRGRDGEMQHRPGNNRRRTASQGFCRE